MKLQNSNETRKIEELAQRLSDSGTQPKNFVGGEIGCTFFRLLYRGEAAVLKAGSIETRPAEEIYSNIQAYNEMRDLQVSPYVAPVIFTHGEENGIAYILLEYAGRDFRNAATVETSVEMTQTLINSLREAYRSSVRSNKTSTIDWLNGIKNHMKGYFVNHLKPAGYVSDDDISLIDRLNIKKIAPNNITWSTADLTPDNIFIKGDRTIIIDPKPNSKGVPLIDLAMFSTVSEEVYQLPNGMICAEKIRDFSSEVYELLEVSEKQGDLLFNLGQARQYTLSSRFRINKDPRANSFARKAVQKIEEILESTQHDK